MNKKNLLAIFSFLFTIVLIAQPPASAVIKRLTHAGVTKVEVVKTVKEWKDGKYIYVAYANVIKAVAPEKVFGLKGITLVIATMAYYDLGASQPYQVLGSESNGEYRGINLPIPSNAELTKFATELAQKNPEKFFMQAYTKIAVEKVTVTNPKAVWLHPGRLQFEGEIIVVDKLTQETFQRMTMPATMVLMRDALNAPWYLGKASAETMQARYIGEIVHASDMPQWASLPSLSDRVADIANKAIIDSMSLSLPPVFNSGKELMQHFHEKLITLSKEHFAAYMKMLLHSTYRQSNTRYTPNGNGQPIIDKIIREAYEGWGKYKDQYCSTITLLEQIGSSIKWYNKNNTRYSSIDATKDGSTWAITGVGIYLDKKQEDDAAFKAMTCSATATTVMVGTTSSNNYTFKKGDKVLVEENGKWYPSTVLDTRPGEWYIHYDGYSAQYDLWVGPARIKNK
jgi:hypothetical protein